MTDSLHDGKRVVITGGASGIGEATAKLLVSEGARVCIADVNEEEANRLVSELRAVGGDAFAHKLDVGVPEQNDELAQIVSERFGGLDSLHLNAGIGIRSTIVDGDVEDWDKVIRVNLTGVYLGMRSCAPLMIKSGGGSIVVTSSVGGMFGGSTLPSYFASKHGVIGLVKAAATELALYDIRVNVICPGVVDTPILGNNHKDPAANARMGASHLMNRIAQPEEIASFVSYLFSSKSSFMTGSAHLIDGGFSCTKETAPKAVAERRARNQRR